MDRNRERERCCSQRNATLRYPPPVGGFRQAETTFSLRQQTFIPKALRRARERAQEAGVEVRLIEGDVTALRATGVGSDFRFLLDFGLFHDELTNEQREAMGREVSAVAAPGATMLMLAWASGSRRLLPRGASRGDIEAAYPAWKVIDEDALVDEPRAPKYVQKADPRFYRLRHE